MNAYAKVHRAQNSAVDLKHVLDVGGFNLSRATEIDPKFMEPSYPFEWAGAYPLPAGTLDLVIGHADHDHDHDHAGHDHAHVHGEGGHHHHHHQGNENELDVVILPVKSLDAADLDAARDQAVVLFSDWESRVKAGDPVMPGAVLHRLLLDEGHGHYPLTIKTPGHYLVFEGCGEEPLHIQQGGENIRPVWQQDFEHTHSHEEDVTSVGISTPGELDGKRLNDWINELLKTKGNDLYRMKGVLSIKGSDKRLVFQGVHMLFDAKFDRPWGKDPRTNTLVFIGKSLDRAALNEGFKSCLV